MYRSINFIRCLFVAGFLLATAAESRPEESSPRGPVSAPTCAEQVAVDPLQPELGEYLSYFELFRDNLPRFFTTKFRPELQVDTGALAAHSAHEPSIDEIIDRELPEIPLRPAMGNDRLQIVRMGKEETVNCRQLMNGFIAAAEKLALKSRNLGVVPPFALSAEDLRVLRDVGKHRDQIWHKEASHNYDLGHIFTTGDKPDFQLGGHTLYKRVVHHQLMLRRFLRNEKQGIPFYASLLATLPKYKDLTKYGIENNDIQLIAIAGFRGVPVDWSKSPVAEQTATRAIYAMGEKARRHLNDVPLFIFSIDAHERLAAEIAKHRFAQFVPPVDQRRSFSLGEQTHPPEYYLRIIRSSRDKLLKEPAKNAFLRQLAKESEFSLTLPNGENEDGVHFLGELRRDLAIWRTRAANDGALGLPRPVAEGQPDPFHLNEAHGKGRQYGEVSDTLFWPTEKETIYNVIVPFAREPFVPGEKGLSPTTSTETEDPFAEEEAKLNELFKIYDDNLERFLHVHPPLPPLHRVLAMPTMIVHLPERLPQSPVTKIRLVRNGVLEDVDPYEIIDEITALYRRIKQKAEQINATPKFRLPDEGTDLRSGTSVFALSTLAPALLHRSLIFRQLFLRQHDELSKLLLIVADSGSKSLFKRREDLIALQAHSIVVAGYLGRTANWDFPHLQDKQLVTRQLYERGAWYRERGRPMPYLDLGDRLLNQLEKEIAEHNFLPFSGVVRKGEESSWTHIKKKLDELRRVVIHNERRVVSAIANHPNDYREKLDVIFAFDLAIPGGGVWANRAFVQTLLREVKLLRKDAYRQGVSDKCLQRPANPPEADADPFQFNQYYDRGYRAGHGDGTADAYRSEAIKALLLSAGIDAEKIDAHPALSEMRRLAVPHSALANAPISEKGSRNLRYYTDIVEKNRSRILATLGASRQKKTASAIARILNPVELSVGDGKAQLSSEFVAELSDSVLAWRREAVELGIQAREKNLGMLLPVALGREDLLGLNDHFLMGYHDKQSTKPLTLKRSDAGDFLVSILRLAGITSDELKTGRSEPQVTDASENPVDFAQGTEQALKEFLDRAELAPIFEAFGDNPDLLYEMLTTLKPDNFTGDQKPIDLVVRYVGLQSEKGSTNVLPRPPPGANISVRQETFLRNLLNVLSSTESHFGSPQEAEKQLHLLIRINELAFTANPQSTILALRSQAARFTVENYPALAAPFLEHLNRIYTGAARHFEKTLTLAPANLVFSPFGYQRPGIQFLLERKRAALIASTGLGKTFMAHYAAEAVQSPKTIWITPSGNVPNIYGELTDQVGPQNHSRIAIVPSGSLRERQEFFASDLSGVRHLIISIDTLRSLHKAGNRAQLDALKQNAKVCIVDEGQLIDNDESLRSLAVQSFTRGFDIVWFLTATPYQNKLANVFTPLNLLFPETFPDEAQFELKYLRTEAGLRQLNLDLLPHMRRIWKDDVLPRFVDGIPFEDQLADGTARVPGMNFISNEEEGVVYLSEAQADLSAQMIADFSGFAQRWNAERPEGTPAIESTGPLVQLQWLERVIYEPSLFGLAQDPLSEALRKSVERRLANGEAQLLWAWNIPVLELLENDYRDQGALDGIYGEKTSTQKGRIIGRFQNESGFRILPASISQGVGVTLTKAATAHVIQAPRSFPHYLQITGRHHRAISRKDLRFAKLNVNTVNWVPKYPPAFLETLTPAMRNIMSAGTIPEQTFRKIAIGQRLYSLVFGGHYESSDLVDDFHSQIARTLKSKVPLTYEPREDLNRHRLDVVAQSFLPLWRAARGNAETEKSVIELVQTLRAFPELAAKLSPIFRRNAGAGVADLKVLSALFALRNRALVNLLADKLPVLLETNYRQNIRLCDIVDSAAADRLSPSVFVASLFAAQRQSAIFKRTTEELDALGSGAKVRRQQVRLATAITEITPEVLTALERREAELLALPVERRVLLLQKIALLVGHGSKFLPKFDALFLEDETDEGIWREIAHQIGRPVEKVKRALTAPWPQPPAFLLSFTLGWRKDERQTAQFKEIYGHVVDGTLSQFRLNGKPRSGNTIPFMDDNSAFWEAIAENGRETYSVVSQNTVSLFESQYPALRSQAATIAEVEGTWMETELHRRKNFTTAAELASQIAIVEHDLQLLLTRTDGSVAGLTGQYGPIEPEKSFVISNPAARLARSLEELLGWLRLDHISAQTSETGYFRDGHVVLRELAKKEARYANGAAEEFTETLRDIVDSLKLRAVDLPRTVTIEEFDEAAWLSLFGELTPELAGCTNPEGSPTRTEFILTLLGSKNMKGLIARDEHGEIIGRAVYKVRKNSRTNQPVLHVEFLRTHRYNAGREMLRYLAEKKITRVKELTGVELEVFETVLGKLRPDAEILEGTGAYTDKELSGALFGIRRADRIKHRSNPWPAK